MIVVDSSALTELLTDHRRRASLVRDRLAEDTVWAGPEHLRVEVASALRGLWLGGRSADDAFNRQLAALAAIQIATSPLTSLLPRIRALAPNATVYDAAYLALAEHMGVPLITLDAKLARVPGTQAEVQLIG